MARGYRWSLIVALTACRPGAGGSSETGAQSSTSTGASSSTDDPGSTPTTGPADPASTGGTDATPDTSTGALTDTSAGPVDATTSTGGASSSSSSAGESGSTGGEAVHCPQTDWAPGCEPVDCANLTTPCGSLFSQYDEQGLLRAPCARPDCDCEHGFECFDASAWGGCVASTMWCGGHTEDCGGAYCVPAGLGPPFACGGTDEAACVGAGCTFVVAPWMEFGPDCQCGDPLPLCLWFPQAGPEAPKLTAYHNPFTLQTRLFPGEWQQPPFGWKPCAGDPDAPPACACAEQCAP